MSFTGSFDCNCEQTQSRAGSIDPEILLSVRAVEGFRLFYPPLHTFLYLYKGKTIRN